MQPIEKSFMYASSAQKYWVYNSSISPTIILLHGFRGTHHGLEKIVEHLPNYRCVVPDLPGFGQSQALTNSRHDLDSFTNYVRTLIDDATKLFQLHFPPVLLGHSFGTIVAAGYAANYPETICRLVLINPIATTPNKGGQKVPTIAALTYLRIGALLPSKLADFWLKSQLVPVFTGLAMIRTKDKDLKRYINDQHAQHMSSFADSKSLTQIFKTSSKTGILTLAPRITVPTLLIAGAKDNLNPVRFQEQLHHAIKNSELIVIGQTGHLTHYEKPAEISRAIKKFLG